MGFQHSPPKPPGNCLDLAAAIKTVFAISMLGSLHVVLYSLVGKSCEQFQSPSGKQGWKRLSKIEELVHVHVAVWPRDEIETLVYLPLKLPLKLYSNIEDKLHDL